MITKCLVFVRVSIPKRRMPGDGALGVLICIAAGRSTQKEEEVQDHLQQRMRSGMDAKELFLRAHSKLFRSAVFSAPWPLGRPYLLACGFTVSKRREAVREDSRQVIEHAVPKTHIAKTAEAVLEIVETELKYSNPCPLHGFPNIS